jgi:hypothetical protein
MTQDEIIEMAIQGHAGTRDAIRWAIKQALAAPVQERNFCERCGKRLGDYIHTCTPPAAQRTWVGLTDDDIITAYETSGHKQVIRPQDVFAVASLARAIEAKLKEKNT